MGLICDGTTTAAAIHHSITKAGGTADGMQPGDPEGLLAYLLGLLNGQPQIQLLIYQYFINLYTLFDIGPELRLFKNFIPSAVLTIEPPTVL